MIENFVIDMIKSGYNNTSKSKSWNVRETVLSHLKVNFGKNSTKTIRLFALDFYEGIVDSAESTITS